MKIIINADMIKEIFKSDQPTVQKILSNKIIKRMVEGFNIVGVYKDDMDANDINNIVIKLIPSERSKSSGK